LHGFAHSLSGYKVSPPRVGSRKPKVCTSPKFRKCKSQLKLFRPRNYKELFNLRHAQLRNVVERIFGVAKKRFAILRNGSNFDEHKNAELIIAFLLIFNFFRIFDNEMNWDPDNWREVGLDTVIETPVHEAGRDEGDLGGHISAAEGRAAEQRRDTIAMSMWAAYVAELARRM
jgi:hypothetical protein